MPHAIDGSWQQFTLTIDLTARPVNVLEVTGGIDNANAPATGTVFRNDIFFIRARGQGPSFNFNGNIDELRRSKPSLSLPRSCSFQRSASSGSHAQHHHERQSPHTVTLIAVKFFRPTANRVARTANTRTHFQQWGVDFRFATHVSRVGMGSLSVRRCRSNRERSRALCFHSLSVNSTL